MKYVSAIYYNEKGNPFRKVIYYSNPHTINNDAVAFTRTKESELMNKSKDKYKDVKGRTFEIDNSSYDLT